jgi:hypothetical protein
MKHVTTILLLSVSILLAACAHRDSGVPPSLFDGTWQSPSLGYDFELQAPLGLALRPRSKSAQDGDPVFRMTSNEGSRFTGRLWMDDGTWHSVTGELKPDGTLQMSNGSKSWTLLKQRE